jgi:hypothetical protein
MRSVTTHTTGILLTPLLLIGTVFSDASAQDAVDAPMQVLTQAATQQQVTTLDDAFANASQASATGEYQQAIKTYEEMLAKDAELHRVRLDYALALFRVGRFQEAKDNFKIVLDKNIPDVVRRNVEQVLAQVEKASKEHYFSGTIATGFNFDTNANSAPKGAHVTVLEQDFELAKKDQAQRDLQGFAMATINHSWQPIGKKDAKSGKTEPSKLSWNSSLTAYKSHQQDVSSLNLAMYNVRTGPEVRLASGKVTLGLAGGFTHVQLAGFTFLRTYAGDASAMLAWDERHQISFVYTEEYRDFVNSDTTSTFEDRQGQAMQGKIGFNYLATPQDILSLALTVRNENTRKDFYDNMSVSPMAAYTHQWDGGAFAQVSLSYKQARYSDADPFVSDRLREDSERTAGLTIGKPINESVSWTMGYQYRSVNSTIKNYQNDNHHVSAMLAAKF